MMEAAMRNDRGEGERAFATKRRRIWSIMALMVVAAGIIGWILGQNRFLFGPSGSISPGLAIGASLAFTAAILGCSWAYFRETDELDLRDNMIAFAAGFYCYVLAFPIWLTLHRAELIPPPRQEVIYVATILVSTAAYFWKRLRP